ncbi:MAG TPA: MauE/DoxX family redox-associated membrane protein [Candidatus Limnocylindrales bacterium]|nr:MauE/DoxX family redox-associated membrane protein [Candidatus Limnocylindrales bacterium]
MIDPAFQLVVRSSLALLLLAAARHKLRDLSHFRSTVDSYRIVPASAVGVLSIAMPVFELALAVMIATGIALSMAGAGAMVLLGAYALAIAINVRRGRLDLDCGCMGPAASVPVSAALVARNAVLVLAAAVLVPPVSVRGLTLLDGIAVLGSTAALAACWAASERMLALAPRVALARRRDSTNAARSA